MSDRVRFGTWHDTAIPANSSGFNGFPIPSIPTIAPGDELYYPAAFTARQAIDLWWRPRSWILTSDFGLSIDDGTDFQSAVISGPADYGGSARELDLIHPDAGMHWVWNATGTGTGTIVLGSFQLHLFGDRGTGADRTIGLFRSGSALYPNIRLQFDMIVTLPGGPFAHLDCYSYQSAGAEGVIAATLMGRPVPLYYTTFGSGVADFQFGHSVFDLSPIYWPYAGADGLPIYDTATGELLPTNLPPPAPQFRSPLL